MVLTNEQVKNIINQYKNDYNINDMQALKVEQIFFKVIKENRNKNKDIDLQESLVTAIMHEIATNETQERIERRYGDNSHMYYFDQVLEEGQSAKIEAALLKYNIPTSVLKSVRRDTPLDANIDGIRVIQEIEKPNPDDTPTVSRFEIYKDGELIYKWTREEGNFFTDEQLEDYEQEAEEQSKREERIEMFKEMQATKSGKQRKNVVFKKEVTPKDTYTYENAVLKNKHIVTIKRDSKGRFAKQ